MAHRQCYGSAEVDARCRATVKADPGWCSDWGLLFNRGNRRALCRSRPAGLTGRLRLSTGIARGTWA